MTKKIIILASGGGTNAENIIRYFQKQPSISVHSVLCNKKDAGVFLRSQALDTPCHWFDASSPNFLLDYCLTHSPDLIVLAGYLRKIPAELIANFTNKIINIHPALLPKYGGKGMYGMHVHTAVKQAKESESGITIHFVNEQYDEGAVIFQATVPLLPQDTPAQIAKKVQSLEYNYFPLIIEKQLA